MDTRWGICGSNVDWTHHHITVKITTNGPIKKYRKIINNLISKCYNRKYFKARKITIKNEYLIRAWIIHIWGL